MTSKTDTTQTVTRISYEQEQAIIQKYFGCHQRDVISAAEFADKTLNQMRVLLFCIQKEIEGKNKDSIIAALTEIGIYLCDDYGIYFSGMSEEMRVCAQAAKENAVKDIPLMEVPS
jgi:hypothetical protein